MVGRNRAGPRSLQTRPEIRSLADRAGYWWRHTRIFTRRYLLGSWNGCCGHRGPDEERRAHDPAVAKRRGRTYGRSHRNWRAMTKHHDLVSADDEALFRHAVRDA